MSDTICSDIMSIYQFLDRVKENPDKYINYCELIITPTGGIILPLIACHVDACCKYAKEKYNRTRESLMEEMKDTSCLPIEWLVDKYDLVAVWYNGYMKPSKGLNRFQKKVIKILEDRNLIQRENQYIQEAKVEHMRKCGVVIKGTKWMKLKLLRKKGNCDVLLLPHKDGSCYTYINLTKYHICPCKFSTIEDAVIDLANKPDIIRYEIISTGFYILKAICIENALGNPSYTVGKSYIVDNTGMTNNFSDKTNIDTWWNAVDLKPKCEEGIEFRHCGCKFRFEFE